MPGAHIPCLPRPGSSCGTHGDKDGRSLAAELLGFLRVDLSGMPLLPAGPWLTAPVRRPHLARYLTRGLQGRVRQQLEAAADPRLGIELRRYAWAFERWADGAYQRLVRQYDEVIEPAHSTLERGGSGAGQALDLDGLRADLAAIESFVA